jgi:hypothetical protein
MRFFLRGHRKRSFLSAGAEKSLLDSHEHDKTKIKITYIRQQGNDNIAGCNNSRDSSQEIDHLKLENKLLSELVEFLKSRDK